MRSAILLLVGLAGQCWGQTGSSSIRVTATRSISVTPDQIAFSLTVTAGPKIGLATIQSTLQTSGLNGISLVAVQTLSAAGLGSGRPGSSSQASIQWTFSYAAPFSNQAAIEDTLTALAQSVPKSLLGASFTYSVSGALVSAQEKAEQTCPVADLLIDATSQAQAIAKAGGKTLGPLTSLSNFTLPATQPQPTFAIAVIGDFVYPTLAPPSIQCSLAVVFSATP